VRSLNLIVAARQVEVKMKYIRYLHLDVDDQFDSVYRTMNFIETISSSPRPVRSTKFGPVRCQSNFR
jgi:hypothetical protein